MELGKKLLKIRKEAIKKGMRLLSEEEILTKIVKEDFIVKMEPVSKYKVRLKRI